MNEYDQWFVDDLKWRLKDPSYDWPYTLLNKLVAIIDSLEAEKEKIAEESEWLSGSARKLYSDNESLQSRLWVIKKAGEPFRVIADRIKNTPRGELWVYTNQPGADVAISFVLSTPQREPNQRVSAELKEADFLRLAEELDKVDKDG